MSILGEAFGEVCTVITSCGQRQGLLFKDHDSQHALFSSVYNQDIDSTVIIALSDIRALEFENEKSKD